MDNIAKFNHGLKYSFVKTRMKTKETTIGAATWDGRECD
jgi:hypothetical protein